jgi:hypothetical protein
VHTYIKATTDFINKIESLRPHANCWLVSFDITNMFTNMPINEILLAVQYFQILKKYLSWFETSKCHSILGLALLKLQHLFSVWIIYRQIRKHCFVNVYKGKRFENNATLDLKTYFKPTNSFMYLHRESCHSRHVFTGFIKGEAFWYMGYI